MAADVARARGLDVRLGRLEDLEHGLGEFDVVLLSHVIEHLIDPIGMLRTARHLLRHDGRIVIITPHVDSFLHHILRSWWQPLEVPRHLILFSRPAIELVLTQAGFDDISVHTSSLVVERIAEDSMAGVLRGRAVPGRVRWLICRAAGVLAQGAAVVIRADARGKGDELQVTAR